MQEEEEGGGGLVGMTCGSLSTWKRKGVLGFSTCCQLKWSHKKLFCSCLNHIWTVPLSHSICKRQFSIKSPKSFFTITFLYFSQGRVMNLGLYISRMSSILKLNPWNLNILVHFLFKEHPVVKDLYHAKAKKKVCGFWSPRASPRICSSAFIYLFVGDETMSNCSHNCYID